MSRGSSIEEHVEVPESSEVERSQEKRYRVQLDLSPQAHASLDEIRELSGARSNAEIVRNAIRLYRWYVERIQREGHQLLIKKDDNVKEVEIVF